MYLNVIDNSLNQTFSESLLVLFTNGNCECSHVAFDCEALLVANQRALLTHQPEGHFTCVAFVPASLFSAMTCIYSRHHAHI
jgi:hypothetical protein